MPFMKLSAALLDQVGKTEMRKRKYKFAVIALLFALIMYVS